MRVIAKKLDPDADGVPGFLAHPEGALKGPGIVMIHHANGVTADMKIAAVELARIGYTVLLPNLYLMLGIAGATHIGQGEAIQKRVSDPEFVRVMTQAWQYLRALENVDGERTAAIGYCMGGRLAIPFGAATSQLRALVLFYPSVRDEGTTELRPRHAFDTAKELKCPSIVIYGGRDHIATVDVQKKLFESFTASGQRFQWHFFSDGYHGFALSEGDRYDPELQRLTWPLVTDFLDRSLGISRPT